MLFDLFGRGFSDGVGDLPHDPRLYVTQMLLVLASSPLAWTGNNGLRLIGYSLGGGIAVHFANAFPHLVESLVLLAPAGLVRPENFGTVTRIVFSSGLVPESILSHLTRRRLQQPIAAPKMPRGAKPGDHQADMALAEAAEGPDEDRLIPLERYVLFYVRWMVTHHPGFVGAFMSCIRFSPLTHQHEYWAKLADRKPGTTAIYFAQSDEVIDSEYYAQQALPLVGGKDHVDWRVMPGAHDFVMTHTAEVMEALDEFWAKE
jgi:pimeloyl-ACP methyl ester carboxylesterase